MHPRKQIRDAVVARLVTAGLAYVENAPGLAIPDRKLPRIVVEIEGDERGGEQPATRSPLRVNRAGEVLVVCVDDWSQGDTESSYRDKLDAMAELVEAALAADEQSLKLGLGFVSRFAYAGTSTARDLTGELVTGLVVRYAVEFVTEHQPGLPAYTGGEIDYHRGAPGDFAEGPHAEDVTNV